MICVYLCPFPSNCANAQIPIRQTGIIESSDNLGIRLTPHLMLNEMLKTFKYILYVPVNGVFEPSFPKFCQYPSICEIGIRQPTEGLATRLKPD